MFTNGVDHQPPFASSITLELVKAVDSDQHFIQVFYKNNSIDEPIKYRQLTISGCDQLCPLDKFMELTKELVVDDFNKACQPKPASLLFTRLVVTIVILLVGIISTAIALFTLRTLKQLRSKRSFQFRHQPLWQYERINLVAEEDDDDDDQEEDVFNEINIQQIVNKWIAQQQQN